MANRGLRKHVAHGQPSKTRQLCVAFIIMSTPSTDRAQACLHTVPHAFHAPGPLLRLSPSPGMPPLLYFLMQPTPGASPLPRHLPCSLLGHSQWLCPITSPESSSLPTGGPLFGQA